MFQLAFCDLKPSQLEDLLTSWGEPNFRVRQLQRWVYHALAYSFEEMTDLPTSLRKKLTESLRLRSLYSVREITSADGETRKVFFRLEDDKTIESVLMTYSKVTRGKDRDTVCVSTQVGCPFGCSFCATGQWGFERNLSAGEMVEQVLHFARETVGSITNVVFMGMGEPLANREATWQAVETLNSPQGFGLGARQMTISTVGLVPEIRWLGQQKLQVGLAVSLHAPNDALRNSLVPVNRKYPLRELLQACRDYMDATKRRVSFEYTLFHEINDSPVQARELGRLLRGLDCHVNLISANPAGNAEFRPPPKERVLTFQNQLIRYNVRNTLRVERGIDIQAGCGQLRGAN